MKICPECQTEFKDDGNVCPNCGKFVPSFHSERPSGFTAVITGETETTEPNPAEEPCLETPETETAEESFPEIPEAEPMEGTALATEEPAAGSLPVPTVSTPSVGSFLLTFILCAIPVIGFFYFFALVFGKTNYPAKKNLARAGLILALVGLAAGALFFTVNTGFALWMTGQMDALVSYFSL